MLPIEVSQLKKNYGDLKAVDDISFSVKQGEVFGLLGPNGAGKTTTIEIMEGLRERDDGDFSVLGMDPWKSGYDVNIWYPLRTLEKPKEVGSFRAFYKN